jgi:hypothetical protein
MCAYLNKLWIVCVGLFLILFSVFVYSAACGNTLLVDCGQYTDNEPETGCEEASGYLCMWDDGCYAYTACQMGMESQAVCEDSYYTWYESGGSVAYSCEWIDQDPPCSSYLDNEPGTGCEEGSGYNCYWDGEVCLNNGPTCFNGPACELDPPADTCTCPSINEDWTVALADSCVINAACDLGTGKLSFTGSGTFKCNSTITTTGLGAINNGMDVQVLSDCRMIIK